MSSGAAAAVFETLRLENAPGMCNDPSLDPRFSVIANHGSTRGSHTCRADGTHLPIPGPGPVGRTIFPPITDNGILLGARCKAEAGSTPTKSTPVSGD